MAFVGDVMQFTHFAEAGFGQLWLLDLERSDMGEALRGGRSIDRIDLLGATPVGREHRATYTLGAQGGPVFHPKMHTPHPTRTACQATSETNEINKYPA